MGIIFKIAAIPKNKLRQQKSPQLRGLWLFGNNKLPHYFFRKPTIFTFSFYLFLRDSLHGMFTAFRANNYVSFTHLTLLEITLYSQSGKYMPDSK